MRQSALPGVGVWLAEGWGSQCVLGKGMEVRKPDTTTVLVGMAVTAGATALDNCVEEC